MERLRTSRLSPIPTSSSSGGGGNVFATVLEEPLSGNNLNNGSSNDLPNHPPLGDSPTDNGNAAGHHLFRKPHRRRLPLVQPCNISKNRSSRSFDSGISCLLQSSMPSHHPATIAEAGSPGPISSEVGGHMGLPPGSPSHISSSRQSYISSPCNSPGPRSPRFRHQPLSPRLHPATASGVHSGAFFGSSFNRRYSEQPESYSLKSSEDSDSNSPPTEPSPPPLGGGVAFNGNGSSPPPPTSPILRVSRRMLPEPPKTPYHVWEQSRDSLDSGVYSRSTTCDSYPGRKSGSPILSSTSPPTLARHSWRRGVARLPEPPIHQSR